MKKKYPRHVLKYKFVESKFKINNLESKLNIK